MKPFQAMILAALALPLASAPAEARDLKKVLSCGGGALVVDVDQDSPKTLQVVVRGREILEYLESSGVLVDRNNEFDATRNGQKPELVLVGTQPTRVSSGNDVVGLQVGDAGSFSRQGYGIRSGFGPFQRHTHKAYFFKEGDGYKLKFDEFLNQVSFSTNCNPSTGCSGSVFYPAENVGERANWYFGDCQAL